MHKKLLKMLLWALEIYRWHTIKHWDLKIVMLLVVTSTERIIMPEQEVDQIHNMSCLIKIILLKNTFVHNISHNIWYCLLWCCKDNRDIVIKYNWSTCHYEDWRHSRSRVSTSTTTFAVEQLSYHHYTDVVELYEVSFSWFMKSGLVGMLRYWGPPI